MCGILFSNSEHVTREQFDVALGEMLHRGPDTVPGQWWSGTVQLGHCRLKILDLDDRSNQPFWSEDRRYVMVYNGEVYNYRELAQKHGLKLETTCDTEVILKLFIKHGPAALGEFNGMFALVIYDTEARDYFIARDRLGVKPLYYFQDGPEFILASEIAPILKLKPSRGFDDVGLRQYLKLRTFFNGRTLYNHIKMFPAGHYFYKGKMVRYWDLDTTPKPDPSLDEIRDMMESAVKYRCIADVPVGSYLSGGLDSTIVACLSREPDTWTVGFSQLNEFDYARMAAEKFGSHHTEVLVTPREFVESAARMIKKRGEPLSVPNEVLLYLMTKEVKKRNTVVLSGEGADELFFGYDRIFRWAATSDWDLAVFSKLYSYGTHDDLEIIEDAVSPFYKHGSCINIVAAFFQQAHLHGLLRRVDNSTMLCSVEARVPFVDYRFIERMAGVSFDFRMKDGIVKEPLKRAYRELLPLEIIERKKVGFPVPLEEIAFGTVTGKTGMDRWLKFNLSHFDIDPEEVIKKALL